MISMIGINWILRLLRDSGAKTKYPCNDKAKDILSACDIVKQYT